MRYAVVTRKGNLVDNVVEWDGTSSWRPPKGCRLVELDPESAAGPGDRITLKGELLKARPPEGIADHVAAALDTLAAKADPGRPDPTEADIVDAFSVLARESR